MTSHQHKTEMKLKHICITPLLYILPVPIVGWLIYRNLGWDEKFLNTGLAFIICLPAMILLVAFRFLLFGIAMLTVPQVLFLYLAYWIYATLFLLLTTMSPKFTQNIPSRTS